jgi:hypothetical protein
MVGTCFQTRIRAQLIPFIALTKYRTTTLEAFGCAPSQRRGLIFL